MNAATKSTPPARLTREQNRERTRELLIETARRLFLERGFQATSLDAVAEAAGFSKGAVYSNFSGKGDLCLAVLDDSRKREFGALLDALAAAGDFDRRMAALEQWSERSLGAEGWTVLGAEAIAAANTDADLRLRLARRDAAFRQLLADGLRRLVEEESVELAVPADEAAAILLSAGIGIGLQRSVGAKLGGRLLVDVTRLIIRRPESGDA